MIDTFGQLRCWIQISIKKFN